MKKIQIRAVLLIATIGLFTTSCSKLEDAKETVDELNKEESAQDNSPCPTYKKNFIETGDSAWLDLYNHDCQDNLAETNMPEDMSADCEKEYKNLIALADSIILSLQGKCSAENIETEQLCIDTKEGIEAKAKAFQEKCNINDFYFPTPEEDPIPRDTIGGKCAWQAWIPEATRMEGQDSTAMIQCEEERSVCSKVIIGDSARIVETHITVEGDTVYLPCIQEASGVFAPCDFNKDRFVDPLETQQCQAGSDDKIELCDWNGDKILDSLEKRECSVRNDSTGVNPGYYDPCDWNFDGAVDEYEAVKCRTAYACTETQTPWWDSDAQKQVCVNNEEIPECQYPTFGSFVSGRVICMDPCDMNRSGDLTEEEKNTCTIHRGCGLDSTGYWDPDKQSNVCIANINIPTCEIPQIQNYLAGEVKCFDPCDRNLDGNLDDFEANGCLTCREGTFPMWDAVSQKSICHEPVPCNEGQYPILRDGVGECIERCDFNQDGVVDEFEKGQCGTTTPNDTSRGSTDPAGT